MTSLKRTPLYPLYAETGEPRCIDFGGWELPVQFSGIQKEHEAVRERAGLFDVSHMGEFLLSGEGACEAISFLTTGGIAALEDGQAVYTFMCYENGGVVDDLIVYRIREEDYMLVVNAGNIDKDADWIKSRLPESVDFRDVSDGTALIALQGPASLPILKKVCGDKGLDDLKPFHFIETGEFEGTMAYISRTGYTGEDGFEIYAAAEHAPAIWRGLIAAGEEFGLLPCGLGARDTLRFEAKLPLYGQELSADITPLEAGLGYFVKLGKGDFIGREALAAQKEAGAPRKLVGLEMIDRGIARSHYPVFAGGRQIGEVTTGTQSPTLKRNLALALIEAEFAPLGTKIEVEIRGKRLQAEIVKAPFYKNTPAHKALIAESASAPTLSDKGVNTP
ncbi:glycine cleavage system aminomethyltransferase GcvT [Saccharibacillus sp. CPCC 101409]|uniref:glycine cleavage system aminomethyltransferase GcvT n=1 Tax=Saccharibacillus sp. CPCC 101409 TaxID=3058041 RepID=UPI002671C0C2|nr:glycine cleavage system aminomethyltransferase GcvT [Saccharibacillus sp. CPCC 101409]MDO3409064.1 glycine cleavage system aminomethyltransferase GcvT [Saccharibacillus sp. CPCC 101409]